MDIKPVYLDIKPSIYYHSVTMLLIITEKNTYSIMYASFRYLFLEISYELFWFSYCWNKKLINVKSGATIVLQYTYVIDMGISSNKVNYYENITETQKVPTSEIYSIKEYYHK